MYFVEKSSSNLGNVSSVVSNEMPWRVARQRLKEGDSITVKHGKYAGRSGTLIRADEPYAYIRETGGNNEVHNNGYVQINELTTIQMTALLSHVEKTTSNPWLDSRVGIAGERRPPLEQREAVADYAANEFTGKLVYVWRHHRKGRVGRAIAISGKEARVQFTGTVGGASVETMKRENLIEW